MRPRWAALVVVCALFSNQCVSAEWVWGTRSSKTTSRPTVRVSTRKPVPTPTEVSVAENLEEFEEDFVAFTEAPEALPQATLLTAAGEDDLIKTTVEGSDIREGRRLESDHYDEIYSDPKVQAALDAGNETEARFFIRDKLCLLGLVDCEPKLPPPPRYPLPPPPHPRPHPNPNDVLLVQPVKLAPHGPPVQAVPLGHPPVPAHGTGPYPGPIKSHYSPPKTTYGAPKPSYSPPKVTYGAPKPSYSPPKSSYGAPKPAYHPPAHNGYGAPKGAYPAPVQSHYSPPHHGGSHGAHGGSHDGGFKGESHSVHLVTDDHSNHHDNHHDSHHDSHHESHDPVVTHIEPSPVVEHHHTHHHTHFENGGRPGKAIDVLPVHPPTYRPVQVGVNRGPELGAAASNFNPVGINQINPRPPAANFNRPVNPQPSGSFATGVSPLGAQYYGEYCVCTPRYACDARDIVTARAGRGTGDTSAISPRVNVKNGTEILSSRTAKSLNAEDILAQVKEVISTEKESISSLSDSLTTPSVSRRRRQAPDIEPAKLPEGRQAVTDAQGRQLGYQPNHRGCFHTDVCCRNPIPVGSGQRRQQPGRCGVGRTDAVNGRIKNYDVREGETVFGEFPWHVAVLKKEGADNVYVCAGSLIGDEYVLTAAHCVKGYDPYDLRIRLGEWDVNHETEFYPHVEKDASGVYIHPQFYGGNLYNDIAIIKLASAVDTVYNLHIGGVCIPPQYADFTHQRCWVSGWGKDAFGEHGNFQNVLKKVSVPVLSSGDCEQRLRRTRLGYDFRLHDGFLCAGGEEGKDACKGDGGGPLVCQQAGSYYLAGIVSWGVGCGERDVPGVYVKVNEYLPWIQSITTYRPYTGIQSRTRQRAEGIEAEDYIEVVKE